ncbi:hypothetical protein D3C73_281210 [compost metagenome]
MQIIIVNHLIRFLVVHRFLVELPPLEIILTKQEIEYQANHRQKNQQQNPGQGAGGIPVLHKDGQPYGNYSQRLKNTDQRASEFTKKSKSQKIKGK